MRQGRGRRWAPRVSPFSKLKCPGVLSGCPSVHCGCCPANSFSFCLPSSSLACGCCPARAVGRLPGAGHGVRGAAAPPLDRMWRCPRTAEKARFFLVLGRGRLLPQPSECFLLKRKHSPPCTPVLPFVREREICLLSRAVPRPPRVAWGVGANLPGRSGRVMSAPAAALRPPCGRTGSPSHPRHRCISAGGGRGNCAGRRFSVKMTGKAGPGGGYSGKPAGGRWAGRQLQRRNLRGNRAGQRQGRESIKPIQTENAL